MVEENTESILNKFEFLHKGFFFLKSFAYWYINIKLSVVMLENGESEDVNL